MARKVIARKSIIFYEGDEELLETIALMAELDKRSFSSFIMKTLEEKAYKFDEIVTEKPLKNKKNNVDDEIRDNKKDEIVVPKETKEIFGNFGNMA